MIIKKFLAKTEAEAIEAAKKELGESIVIMNVRLTKPKGLFAAFRPKQTEVTVALEEEKESEVLARSKVPPTPDLTKGKVGAEKVIETTPPPLGVQTDISRKLDSLQTLLEKQLNPKEKESEEAEGGFDEKVASEELEEIVDTEQDKFVRLLYNTLIDNEVDEKYANQILEDLDKTRKANMPFDYILASVYQRMVLKFGKAECITPNAKGPKVVFFIGPTGVGKTTTIAKLAGHYAVEEKKKLALLTTDTYRIAAAEQSRTYAQILEVPFRVVYTEEELYATIQQFHDYDYIFVDTMGHSHRNEQQMGSVKAFIEPLNGMVEYQVFLVLSAATKYKDLLKIAENYHGVADYQLIFTKLDETMTVGNLYNLRMYTSAPIAYVTYGQNVPSDIEPFNPQKTVKQILGGKA